MSKHTPGPWKYEPDAGGIFYDDGDLMPVIASTNLENVNVEQGDADGKLIAASPDLLAALEAIVSTHYDEFGTIDLRSANTIVGRDRHDQLQLKGSFIAALERARAAIAKATS